MRSIVELKMERKALRTAYLAIAEQEDSLFEVESRQCQNREGIDEAFDTILASLDETIMRIHDRLANLRQRIKDEEARRAILNRHSLEGRTE